MVRETQCRVDFCTDLTVGQGLCRKHYSRNARTGDPTKTKRELAPKESRKCLIVDCRNEYTVLSTSTRKYCSRKCYYLGSSKITRKYQERLCCHCGAPYFPVGAIQKFCPTCLGKPITRQDGTIKYSGQKRLLTYGVSAPEWALMVEKHDGKCWICKNNPAVALDHCHNSGKPRGALCMPCNSTLHSLEKSGWVTAAQEYLAENG